MNCIPGSGKCDRQKKSATRSRGNAVILYGAISWILALSAACNAPASATKATSVTRPAQYDLEVQLAPKPLQGTILVRLKLQQDDHLLRQLRMTAPAEWFSNFDGDGFVTINGGEVLWQPPEEGGSLQWVVEINRHRSGNHFDAYMTENWALFRASDVFPPAATRTKKGATAKTTLVFSLPPKWSSVTQYAGRRNRYPIDNPARRFDRPTGWILLGQIGTRTEKISGSRITIAAPKYQQIGRASCRERV